MADLAREWGVPALHAYAQVGSTNDVARALAVSGASDGTVVIADEQMAGRGRAGRPWRSAPGLGLWLSMIWRPSSLTSAAAIPIHVGLEAAAALESQIPDRSIQIKWPNDLFVGGRKIGGILCEAVWGGSNPSFVIVGIGLNVRHARDDFPADLRARATSVLMEGDSEPSITAIASHLLRGLRARLAGDLSLRGEALAALARRDFLRGKSFAIVDPVSGSELHRGRGAGIAADGALRILNESGETHMILSGTVRIQHEL